MFLIIASVISLAPATLRSRHADVGARPRGVTLRLIEPRKPNQNAYFESSNGRFRDECLNKHWFTSVPHAQTIIETWRREYNEERPKKGLGGLTPAAYARQLTAGLKMAKVTAGF